MSDEKKAFKLEIYGRNKLFPVGNDTVFLEVCSVKSRREENETLYKVLDIVNQHDDLTAEVERLKADNERLRDSGNKLLAVVDDYVNYTHSGDPWEEDARVMNEMDIDEINNNGELDEIRKVLTNNNQ